MTNDLVNKEKFKIGLPLFTAAMFFFCYVDRAIFGPLLTQIEVDFAISHAQSTLCLLYISAGYAISMLFSGISATFFTARHLAGTAVILSGSVLIMMAQVDDWRIFSCLFVLLGLTSGQYFNGGMGVLRSDVPKRYFSYAISLHELGPSLSFILAPLLAQTGLHYFGWRGVLVATGFFSILCGIAYFFSGKKRYTPPQISLTGLKQLIVTPKVWIFAWLFGLAITGEFAPFSVLTIHLTEERHMTADAAAALLSCSRVFVPVALLAGGWLTLRFGSKATVKGCFFFLAASLAMLAAPWFSVMLIGLFVHPIVTSLIFPPAFTLMTEVFSAKDQPLVVALSMPIASLIGGGIMPSLLGFAGEHFTFSSGFIVLAFLFASFIPLIKYLKKDSENLKNV